MALAHKIPDAVEAAYRRGDLFEKRRRLMDAWAEYCMRPQARNKVLPLQQRREMINKKSHKRHTGRTPGTHQVAQTRGPT